MGCDENEPKDKSFWINEIIELLKTYTKNENVEQQPYSVQKLNESLLENVQKLIDQIIAGKLSEAVELNDQVKRVNGSSYQFFLLNLSPLNFMKELYIVMYII